MTENGEKLSDERVSTDGPGHPAPGSIENGRDNGEFEEWDAAAEKRLIRKIDWKLIPFLSLLYLLSFLDRVNIGQARLNNLEKDLHLHGNQYNVALVVFFVGYVVTETPSNIALKWLRPSRWIPFIMFWWSVTMTLMGTVSNYGGLVAARFCLGLAESGLFPGICFYLSMWYKRSEQNLRISIFFSSATLSGAFGGLLAYGISHMDGIGGKGGWAWIFIIEGLVTFVVALAAPFLIDDFPEDSKKLTASEKAFVVRRLKQDQGAAGEAPFQWSHIWSAFKDWKTPMYMLIYISVAEPLYALALFVPTIISKLGTFSKPEAQLLSVPPYALAFVITLASAWYSDRIQKRGIFNIFWMLVTCVGYAILLGVNPSKHPAVCYFAVFLAVTGVAPSISNTITWMVSNCGPAYKRAAASGLMFTCGNSGGIISSLVYITSDAPTFKRGHGVCLAFSLLAVILSTVTMVILSRENARRDRLYGSASSYLENSNDALLNEKHQAQLRSWGIDNLSEDEIAALGDQHPGFRYLP